MVKNPHLLCLKMSRLNKSVLPRRQVITSGEVIEQLGRYLGSAIAVIVINPIQPYKENLGGWCYQSG